MCDGENKMWVEQVRVRGRGGRVLHQELKPSPLHSCRLARLSPVFDTGQHAPPHLCFTGGMTQLSVQWFLKGAGVKKSRRERAMVVGGLDQGLLCTCMIMSWVKVL